MKLSASIKNILTLCLWQKLTACRVCHTILFSCASGTLQRTRDKGILIVERGKKHSLLPSHVAVIYYSSEFKKRGGALHSPLVTWVSLGLSLTATAPLFSGAARVSAVQPREKRKNGQTATSHCGSDSLHDFAWQKLNSYLMTRLHDDCSKGGEERKTFLPEYFNLVLKTWLSLPQFVANICRLWNLLAIVLTLCLCNSPCSFLLPFTHKQDSHQINIQWAV